MVEGVIGEGRYSRQIAVPTLGLEGQQQLAQASVCIVGAGGVKSPLLLYLAAAGVGHIRIIDHDVVELSNLNRQILYDTDDLGQFKAVAAAARLQRLNPEIKIEALVERAQPDNFDRLLSGFDLVLEGGENAQGRRDFNRWAISRSQTYIHASAQYNYAYVCTVVPGKSPCFECMFDDLPASHGGPVPILGPAAGVAGSVAAAEVLSILSGLGSPLAGKMFYFDGWAGWSNTFTLSRLSHCPACHEAW